MGVTDGLTIEHKHVVGQHVAQATVAAARAEADEARQVVRARQVQGAAPAVHAPLLRRRQPRAIPDRGGGDVAPRRRQATRPGDRFRRRGPAPLFRALAVATGASPAVAASLSRSSQPAPTRQPGAQRHHVGGRRGRGGVGQSRAAVAVLEVDHSACALDAIEHRADGGARAVAERENGDPRRRVAKDTAHGLDEVFEAAAGGDADDDLSATHPHAVTELEAATAHGPDYRPRRPETPCKTPGDC